MGITWSTYKSKRGEKAKAKRYKVTKSLDFTSRLTSQKSFYNFSFPFFTGYGMKIASVFLTLTVFPRDFLWQHLEWKRTIYHSKKTYMSIKTSSLQANNGNCRTRA